MQALAPTGSDVVFLQQLEPIDALSLRDRPGHLQKE